MRRTLQGLDPARLPVAPLAMLAILAGSAPASVAAAAEPDLDFELYDLSDRLVRTERLRTGEGARLLVVDFFEVSCEPCKKALSEWQKALAAYQSHGLVLLVVAIPSDGPRDAAERGVKDWFREHPQPFPVLFDRYRKVSRLYGVVTDDSMRVPQAFLLDRAGSLLLRTGRTEPIVEEIGRRLGK